MDISKWPLDRIMQLPDWCFGRQWWIGTYVGTTGGAESYFFIEDLPPDIFVLWDVMIHTKGRVAATGVNVSLRLCRQVPTAANMRPMTRLLRQFANPAQFYDLYLPPMAISHLGPMRVVVEAQNNGVGGVLKIVEETGTCENGVGLLVSAIPREVPDWVVSGMAGSR